ncbi:MAG: hypothetical protein JWO75_4678 [Actinomycetia bacterium]|nr:hypothetical protein [Actinomycetes bacterium]
MTRIRDRGEGDVGTCVEALRAVYQASGYPTNWPPDRPPDPVRNPPQGRLWSSGQGPAGGAPGRGGAGGPGQPWSIVRSAPVVAIQQGCKCMNRSFARLAAPPFPMTLTPRGYQPMIAGQRRRNATLLTHDDVQAGFRVEFYVRTGEMPARYPRARGCLARLTHNHGPSSPHKGRRRRRHRRCVPGRRLVACR